MARATISDVAAAAGVSQATVSRALRGSANVSPATRAKVEQAAESLNFTLSKSASTLASGRTMRVLLLVSGPLNTWFNASVLQGVYNVLAPEGYDIIPSFVLNRSQLDRFFRNLPRDRNADAIIITSFKFDTTLHDQLSALGMPVVGLNSPSTAGFDASIGIDNASAIASGVHLLRSLGHQRIAFVHNYIPHDMVYGTSTRAAAFRAAAADAGYAEHDAIMIEADQRDAATATPGTTEASATTAAHIVARLLSCNRHPTGIMGETDEFTIPVYKELLRQHIAAPRDFSIMGFDDAPISRALDLTTLHQDPAALGSAAARKVLALLRGETIGHVHELVPATLVLRDTTGRAPDGR